MRKLFAISMLCVLVFNFCGYKLLLGYLQTDLQSRIEKRLDRNDYDENDLITIKTVLHLPYYSSSPDFEKAYGSINVGGVDYEYVKRRVYQDTLELLCLPNHGKTNLTAAGRDYLQRTIEGQEPAKKTPTVVKLSLPDFFQEHELFEAFQPGFITQRFHPFHSENLPAGFHTSLYQPPRA